jgi:integrase
MAWTVTEESARSLDLDGKNDLIKFDDKFPRFGVRVRRLTDGKISRTYVYQYKIKGKTSRMLCGAVGVVTAQEARRIAKDHEITLLKNGDPAADRRARRAHEGHTLGETVKQYLAAKADSLRENTLMGLRLHLGKRWEKFHSRTLDEITSLEVSERLTQITEKYGPAAGNRARICLSVLYVWARKRSLCTTNPTTNTEKAKENGPRERVLSDPEIAALWQATEGNDDNRQVIRLLLLTGCRAREIGGLVPTFLLG